jgi:hypothetical protein
MGEGIWNRNGGSMRKVEKKCIMRGFKISVLHRREARFRNNGGGDKQNMEHEWER